MRISRHHDGRPGCLNRAYQQLSARMQRLISRFPLPSNVTAVRTRFAPSPTGFLHLGNIRSALFPWAFARHHQRHVHPAHRGHRPGALDAGGRAGDPRRDGVARPRLRRGAVLPDAADGPLSRGARRHARARTRLSLLHDARRARRAARRADGARRKAALRRPLAARECAGQDAARRASRRCSASAIRTTAPSPGTTRSRARSRSRNAELDDLVIARADGTPTYNFCVVVDDLDMRITHVIRGDDHVNNTPRQINILRALGATPPVYAHLPTVLTPDGEKLSKRHGARGVLQYRDDGYLPRGAGQLPGAPGLGARRRRSVQRRASSSAGSTSRDCRRRRALRSREAEMAQPRAPEAARPRRARTNA